MEVGCRCDNTRANLHLEEHVAGGERCANDELHERTLLNHYEDAHEGQAARHLTQLQPEGPPACERGRKHTSGGGRTRSWAECMVGLRGWAVGGKRAVLTARTRDRGSGWHN